MKTFLKSVRYFGGGVRNRIDLNSKWNLEMLRCVNEFYLDNSDSTSIVDDSYFDTVEGFQENTDYRCQSHLSGAVATAPEANTDKTSYLNLVFLYDFNVCTEVNPSRQRSLTRLTNDIFFNHLATVLNFCDCDDSDRIIHPIQSSNGSYRQEAAIYNGKINGIRLSLSSMSNLPDPLIECGSRPNIQTKSYLVHGLLTLIIDMGGEKWSKNTSFGIYEYLKNSLTSMDLASDEALITNLNFTLPSDLPMGSQSIKYGHYVDRQLRFSDHLSLGLLVGISILVVSLSMILFALLKVFYHRKKSSKCLDSVTYDTEYAGETSCSAALAAKDPPTTMKLQWLHACLSVPTKTCSSTIDPECPNISIEMSNKFTTSPSHELCQVEQPNTSRRLSRSRSLTDDGEDQPPIPREYQLVVRQRTQCYEGRRLSSSIASCHGDVCVEDITGIPNASEEEEEAGSTADDEFSEGTDNGGFSDDDGFEGEGSKSSRRVPSLASMLYVHDQSIIKNRRTEQKLDDDNSSSHSSPNEDSC